MSGYKVVTHIYTVTMLIKKNEIFTICNSMNGPRGYYAKGKESDKDKYHMISLICGI